MPRTPLLLALALAVLAAASAPLAARADGAAPPAATVTIAPSDGGAARTLDLAALADRFDVHGVAYTLRAADGTTSRLTVADGISLNALLTAAGLDADAFDYLDIPRADGSSAILMRDDLGGADEGPPVVWSDPQGVHFLRPSGGNGDANADDLVTIGDGPIAVALKRGQPLVPRIAVSTFRAHPHERIVFGASLVGGAPLGPGLDYEWYLDGFGKIRGANVSHIFPPGGPYLVVLNIVRGDGTYVGRSETVNVWVARPRADRSGDAHGAGGGAGAGTGSGGGAGAGSGSGSGTSGSGAATSGYVAPATPPTASQPPTPTPAPSHAPAPAPRPRGELVSGTLIASASAAATPAGGVLAARAVERSVASDGPLHVPVGVWVGVGLALLLALGWVLESRHTLPFWQP